METANLNSTPRLCAQEQPPQFSALDLQELWCADCNQRIDPTPLNAIGYLYCALARHKIVTLGPLPGLDRYDAMIDRAFARAGLME